MISTESMGEWFREGVEAARNRPKTPGEVMSEMIEQSLGMNPMDVVRLINSHQDLDVLSRVNLYEVVRTLNSGRRESTTQRHCFQVDQHSKTISYGELDHRGRG